ncbi:hypothetical protein BH10ACI2_BH10ACI2_14450 [soil metagenome]
MRKIVISFGLAAGAIMIACIFLEGTLVSRGIVQTAWMEMIGYATMLVSLSMVFFGIKSYRDNHAGGVITFWKGFQIGVLISLIASVLYFCGGELYNAVNPDFFPKVMERVTEQQKISMKEKGATDEEIAKKDEELANIMTLFKNPLLRFAVFLMEMFPIGVIITLISAALLRRREFLPA